MIVTFRRIRNTEKDLQQYLVVERAVGGSPLTLVSETVPEARRELFGENTVAYFILADQKVAGAIVYIDMRSGPQVGYVYVTEVAIRPKFQKMGIGREALEHVLAEHPREEFQLVTHPHNTPAVKLYLSLGFVIKAWYDDHFDDGEPRLKMVRKPK